MSTQKNVDVLIIGGGPAGRTVARVLKKKKPQLNVTLIKEYEINPNRCVIPYIYDDTVPFEKGLIPNSLVTEVNAELIIEEVSSIDAKHKIVKLNDQTIHYDKLVFATGSRAIRPPIEGNSLAGTVVVRTKTDVETLLSERKKAKHATIIGLGLIGAEVATSLKRAGLDVTGIDLEENILGRTLDRDYAERVTNLMKDKGIELILGEQVETIIGENNRVKAVKLKDKQIPTDLVVFATGVKANTELAEIIGAKVDANGIVVNANQETTIKDIYAVGDCVATRCLLTQKSKPAALGTTAVIQAKVAARQILGKKGPLATFEGTLGSWACQLYDLPVGALGLREEEAKKAGIDIVVGNSKTVSQYPQMPHVQQTSARLIFEKESMRILGGQIIGTFAVAGYLDLLALAINKKLNAVDLATIQYATHPELAPKPSDNLIVMAAMNAIEQ